MPDAQHQTKIFCIGFNKTGTSSLHDFFAATGLRSTHNSIWPHQSRVRSGQGYFEKHDCYSDGERADFGKLRKWFPDAVFVLNTRDDRAWVRSRIKHVMRRNETVSIEKAVNSGQYGILARDFYTDPSTAIARWYLDKRIYERQARVYFQDSPRFLEIDITKDEHWVENLSRHMKDNGVNFRGTEGKEFKKNVRSADEIKDVELLNKYYDLADTIMAYLDGLPVVER